MITLEKSDEQELAVDARKHFFRERNSRNILCNTMCLTWKKWFFSRKIIKNMNRTKWKVVWLLYLKAERSRSESERTSYKTPWGSTCAVKYFMHPESCRATQIFSNPILYSEKIKILREGFKKKHDKLGLLAEPPLTPPSHQNFGPVIWFGNVFLAC